MSAAKVDVLRLLDALHGEAFALNGHVAAHPIWEARTAVAELIEAIKDSGLPGDGCTCGRCQRLRAAVARIGGAA